MLRTSPARPVERDASGPPTGASGYGTVALAVLGGALFLFGLVERVWMVNHLPINSDQAVNGLMSLGIVHGHFGAITWGQKYGGVEPYVTSVLFALFGHSDTALNLTPVVLSVTAALLVYGVARHFLPRTLAGLAAMAVWVWPAIVVRNGAAELGYRYACLNLGLLAISCAVSIHEQGASRRRYAMLGLVLGLSLWANPDCIYFLVPCAVLLAPEAIRGWSSDRQKTATELLGAVVGVFVGGLPLWWSTQTHHGVSLSPYPGTISTRAHALVAHAAPLAVGVQVPGTGAWFGGSAVGITIFVAVIGAVVLGLVWAVAHHRPRTIVALIAFVVAYPIIYSLLPATWAWQDGRYILYLPYVFIIVAFYPLGLLRWRRVVPVATAVVVLGAALVTAAELSTSVPGLSLGALPHALVVQRISLAPLARALERRRVTLGYAGYWVAYNLDFESGGALRFTPTEFDTVRNDSYFFAARADPRPAWILCRPDRAATCTAVAGNARVDPPGVTWTSLSSWLQRHHSAYRTVSVGGFTAFFPSTKVTPAQLHPQVRAPASP
ncbi:MAG TPA: glycosyltransferase family 39 protein [Acidimicrobiales bacterium]|nr:glycosyltransferase family 39 protein [Acidimicrobiales bacterium]